MQFIISLSFTRFINMKCATFSALKIASGATLLVSKVASASMVLEVQEITFFLSLFFIYLFIILRFFNVNSSDFHLGIWSNHIMTFFIPTSDHVLAGCKNKRVVYFFTLLFKRYDIRIHYSTACWHFCGFSAKWNN